MAPFLNSCHRALRMDNLKATHPDTKKALDWMGFEARNTLLEVLDLAIDDDTAEVCVVAFDLNEKEIVTKLSRLGKRLRIIIDNSKDYKGEEAAETQAEKQLMKTAGKTNVKRQHMENLQHNKTIVVDGKKTKRVV